MNSVRTLKVIAIGIAIMCCIPASAENLANIINGTSDIQLNWGFKFKPEFFYGKNIYLLNNNVPEDRVAYVRQICDLDFGSLYGVKTYGFNVIEFKSQLRNKVFWGNPTVAKTTESTAKIFGVVTGNHKHDIVRLFPWFRELWMRIDVGTMFGLSFNNGHELTIGAFPFQLGRGIALGDAYAVGPEELGFYTDDAIDNYAYGVRMAGDFTRSVTYEVYSAMLRNKSTNLGETAADIYSQEYGRRLTPERGFGKITWIIAGHTFWTPFDRPSGKLTIEPYILFTQDPEQKVEFQGDASTLLSTIGIAGEYSHNRFEFGFDTAFNLGNQSVKGWDRNQVVSKDANTFLQPVNSHVRIGSATGAQVGFVQDSDAQNLIESSLQDAIYNGKKIGTVPNPDGTPGNIDLYNAINRFRNPYINRLNGSMFVFDMGYWLYKKDLVAAMTYGFASGDDNPNFEVIDGDYQGFIPLQEVYSGQRVKSAFLMRGAGRVPRPTSAPIDPIYAPTKFSTAVSGFSNLVFTGFGFTYKPQEEKHRQYSVNPNVLFYWEEHPSKKFDLITKMDSNAVSCPFLGTECNVFITKVLLKGLRAFFVGSIFMPGQHYTDIRGRPLNKDQEEELQSYDVTDDDRAPIPNISDDVAVTFNFGLDYSF
jgi:hypothetical protein